ncbi:MAG: MgtC/SapB family protein [Clostridia bacterium]|nr:MgtC/SapB family protein [Clostridia bacterium]
MERILEILNGFNCWSIAFRILLATLTGGLIGAERGSHGRAAGLRTHILVCVGAAITTLTGIYAMNELKSAGDPMRLGAQVISGIGFLGAGTIMVRNHSHVSGLTTAAGLWATACMGLAIGAGFYEAVIPAFALIMITMTLLIRLERATKPRVRSSYYVELSSLESARKLYESVAEFVYEVDIVPAKSGLPEHAGLELMVSSSEGNRRVRKKLESSDEVAIFIPLS